MDSATTSGQGGPVSEPDGQDLGLYPRTGDRARDSRVTSTEQPDFPTAPPVAAPPPPPGAVPPSPPGAVPPPPPSQPMAPMAPMAPKRSVVDRLGGRRRIVAVLGVVVLLLATLAAGFGLGSSSAQDEADRRIDDAESAAISRVETAKGETAEVEAARDEAEQRADDAEAAKDSAEERANTQMEERLKKARDEDADNLAERKADQDAAAKKRSGEMDARSGRLDQRQRDLDAKSADISAREAAVSQTEQSAITDGLYEVGKDMAPGKYHTDGPEGFGCYYALLSAPNGNSVDHIIDNNNVSGPATILVDSPYFESNGCGTWTKVG